MVFIQHINKVNITLTRHLILKTVQQIKHTYYIVFYIDKHVIVYLNENKKILIV